MKVVQIGVGGWGKNHSRILSEFDVLSAVCDANLERAEEFGKKYSVNFYNSVENLLDQEEYDAALVCTPTITLGFKDNKTATISSNWITPIRVRNFNAVCTDARIFSDFITQEVRIETGNDTETPKNEKVEPLSLEIRNFLDAIDGKNELVVKPEQAVNVTKIAEAALLSSQRGTPIYLDLR